MSVSRFEDETMGFGCFVLIIRSLCSSDMVSVFYIMDTYFISFLLS